MKIAQIAPIIERVPPKKYGGTERVIHALTEELVARGHEVTLFATGDSQTSARLVATYPRALREDFPEPSIKRMVWSLRHVGAAYSMQDEFDIIHDHTGWLGASLANTSQTPTVMTLHGAFTEESKSTFRIFNKPHLVTISDSQASFAPDLNYAATVYNGLPLSHYPFSRTHDGYLLFVGRLCADKTPHYAVQVAKKLGLPLILAAKCEGKEGNAYYEQYIKPYLSDTIRWIGEVDEKERNKLYSRAMAFLHPVSWPEPFGLTLIEAMAAGCPVVAFNQGAIPEVVAHGKTGFVAQDVTEMTHYVQQIDTISRKECRDYALTHFSDTTMTDGY